LQAVLYVDRQYVNKHCVVKITVISERELESAGGPSMCLTVLAELGQFRELLEVGFMTCALENLVHASG
jgi:hypothetical protein